MDLHLHNIWIVCIICYYYYTDKWWRCNTHTHTRTRSVYRTVNVRAHTFTSISDLEKEDQQKENFFKCVLNIATMVERTIEVWSKKIKTNRYEEKQKLCKPTYNNLHFSLHKRTRTHTHTNTNTRIYFALFDLYFQK